MIKETTKAKVEFHERYWKNVSKEGPLLIPLDLQDRQSEPHEFDFPSAKDFILALIKADPSQRLTAEEALQHKWMTDHQPSKEHDLSGGLRDNWCAPVPRASPDDALTN